MSEIKVNNIQSLSGTNGPVISGTVEMNSTGAMALPRGDTAYRGGRGRGMFGGGTPTPGSRTNLVDYITIASTGNAIDFGNLTAGNRNGRACSNTTRLVKGAGSATGGGADVIDYITMASLGNATRFGDLVSSHTEFSASLSSQTRGFWCAGRNPNNITVIQKVEIATAGNAETFGDMGTARQKVAGLSDSHGGLGGF